jgi:hypothetical protein
LTTAQQPVQLHISLYNTSDIDGVPERDKPFYVAAAAAAATLNLATTSPVQKIL